MGRKRLITDSFRAVKKRKRIAKKKKEAQSPSSSTTESLPKDAARPDQLELLKQFDLSWQYGPCTGITRLQRWERADVLGLEPPVTVRDLLMKYNEDPLVTYCLWHRYCL